MFFSKKCHYLVTKIAQVKSFEIIDLLMSIKLNLKYIYIFKL